MVAFPAHEMEGLGRTHCYPAFSLNTLQFPVTSQPEHLPKAVLVPWSFLDYLSYYKYFPLACDFSESNAFIFFYYEKF